MEDVDLFIKQYEKVHGSLANCSKAITSWSKGENTN